MSGRCRRGRIRLPRPRITDGSEDSLTLGEDACVANLAEPYGDAGLDINVDARAFFLGLASFAKHVEAQQQNLSRYSAAIALLLKDGAEPPLKSRVRVLAACWACHNHALADSLLTFREAFGLSEVLKALSILDVERMSRTWERKLKQAEVGAAVSGGRVRKRTISRAKYNRDNLRSLRPHGLPSGSLSGALVRRLRHWVRGFSREELEFVVLHYPVEPWRRLADLLHLHPEKDFPELPWFLRYCFDGRIPEDSPLFKAKQITAKNVNEIISEVAVPFSTVRHLASELSDDSKAAIVGKESSLDRALWWYEELACEQVDAQITARLEAGEQLRMNFGKLMERLIFFRLAQNPPPFLPLLLPFAEEKLQSARLSADSPIAVLADASSSMGVSIRTATVIASLLSASTSAKLVFFNTSFWMANTLPRNAEDVLQLALKTRPSGSAAHAAGLWPFFERKEKIGTFILVTDEEENASYKNCRFVNLFLRYRSEVSNANLLFVSFLPNQRRTGVLSHGLHASGIYPLFCRLDPERPDLSKLESILSSVTGQSFSDFAPRLAQMEAELAARGSAAVFAEVASRLPIRPLE